MSRDQRVALDALMREAPLDLGGELDEQREILKQMLTEIPLAPDVSLTEITLGAVPGIRVKLATSRDERVILYLHGGAYALGSARTGVGLASEVARRCGAIAYSVEYRLAPEHPYPAGVEDCLAAYRAVLEDGAAPHRVAIVGESAGAGLVAATLAAARSAQLPQPACAALMSPWADLTLTSTTLETKASVDPVLTRAGLRRRRDEYVAADRAREASPVYADFTACAPMLIQAGSHEVLVGDAIALAQQVIQDDGRVDLQIWPEVPHVFQGFASMLGEGKEALDALGAFIQRRLEPTGSRAET
jgi:acetyl esterase/lipase